ncbi:hypothetical protein QBC44DRAFT_49516 [Cladorrhinum sp. PSN332]|nr:hypothetical protein QBC44DRAFT_49516 [Cladorrhinum sp. PSN332]
MSLRDRGYKMLRNDPGSPNTTSNDLAERLWNSAYDQLIAEKPDLVAAYEKILCRQLNHDDPKGKAKAFSIAHDQNARRLQMQQLVQRALEKAQQTNPVQEGVDNAVQVTLALKGVIDAAVHSAPQAALAWAGIAVVLQLLVNSQKETESNREGIVYIAKRMDWYWALANLILSRQLSHGPTLSLRRELERNITDLYAAILSYQMMSVCACYRKRRFGFVRDLFRLDDWEGTLQQIQSMEDRFRQDSNEFNSQRGVQLLETLVENTNLERERPSVASPVTAETKLGHRLLPFGRNSGFLGREEIMADLLGKISPDLDPDNCHRIAIEGLGGIGKTQIALEAAFRLHRMRPSCSIFWVPAMDVASFDNAYREIGILLQVDGIDQPGADVRSLVKAALSQTPDEWLLIVDNIDDTDLFFTSRLHDCIPFSYHGSILVTTRNHDVVTRLGVSPENVIPVPEMNRTDAEQLLRQNLDASQLLDETDTQNLLEFLGDIPLAIKQASAYMYRTRMSVSRYLTHCTSSDRGLIELLSKDFEDQGRYRGSQNSVATTWLISFQHMRRDSPLAAEFLETISFLTDKAIPREMVILRLRDGSVTRRDGICEPALVVEEAIGVLKAYGFVTERAVEAGFYDVHRLVQLAMRNWLLKQGALGDRFEEVISCLQMVYPSIEWIAKENKELWVRYLPCLQKILEYREVLPVENNPVVVPDLTARAAKSNELLWRYQVAAGYYQQAAAGFEVVYGLEHDATLDSISSLIWLYLSMREWAKSLDVYRRVYPTFRKVYGPSSSITLNATTRFSRSLRWTGQVAEARDLIQQYLDENGHLLDGHQVRSLTTELAKAEGRLGGPQERVNRLRAVLDSFDGSEKLTLKLGMTATYGIALMGQDRFAEAEKLLKEALKGFQELGYSQVDHHDTLQVFLHVATCVWMQDRYSEAESMYRHAATACQELLKNMQDASFETQERLGRCLVQQQKYDEAIPILTDAFAKSKELHGLDRKLTAEVLSCLGLANLRLGRYLEAERWYREATIWAKRLNIHVLNSKYVGGNMYRLGDCLREQKKFSEAEKVYEEALKLYGEKTEKVNVYHLLHRLSVVCEAQGKVAEAKQYQEEMAAIELHDGD